MNEQEILEQWRAERARRKRDVRECRRVAGVALRSELGDWSCQLQRSLEFLASGAFGQAPLIEFARLTRRMNRRAWMFNTAIAEEFRLNETDARRVWRMLSDADKDAANVLCDAALAQMDAQEN